MRMRGKLFVVVAVLLVVVIFFCVAGTVASKERDERGKKNRHYAVLEQEYLDSIRHLLEEQGLRDCGINIRWVADVDGSREYTVLLHHRRLNRMTEEEKLVLTDMLAEMEFQDESCNFLYEL